MNWLIGCSLYIAGALATLCVSRYHWKIASAIRPWSTGDYNRLMPLAWPVAIPVFGIWLGLLKLCKLPDALAERSIARIKASKELEQY
jgi:hypothetical protein